MREEGPYVRPAGLGNMVRPEDGFGPALRARWPVLLALDWAQKSLSLACGNRPSALVHTVVTEILFVGSKAIALPDSSRRVHAFVDIPTTYHLQIQVHRELERQAAAKGMKNEPFFNKLLLEYFQQRGFDLSTAIFAGAPWPKLGVLGLNSRTTYEWPFLEAISKDFIASMGVLLRRVLRARSTSTTGI